MSNRSPLGKRNECFFLRMHPEELNDLSRRAAAHGLSRSDYARKRLLEQVIPALPPTLPDIHYLSQPLLSALKKRVQDLHRYCSTSGPIDWNGQEVAGMHIYDEIERVTMELEALRKILPSA